MPSEPGKGRIDVAKRQLAAAEEKALRMTEAAVTSWKLFEIETPDGRVIRHRHQTLYAAENALQNGYKVTGEVFGASTDDKGGMVSPIGPGTTSLMRTLLEAHGDELLGWLAKRGIR